jgi:hypothetical protein
MTTETQKALNDVKAFVVNNGGVGWVDDLVLTLAGQSVEDMNSAIHTAADGLYAGLRETQPTMAFGITRAFVSLVHDRLEAKLGAQADKKEPGRSPWRRWELQ